VVVSDRLSTADLTDEQIERVETAERHQIEERDR
jgi:hypothetical protein